jgi:hypothetical protein
MQGDTHGFCVVLKKRLDVPPNPRSPKILQLRANPPQAGIQLVGK